MSRQIIELSKHGTILSTRDQGDSILQEIVAILENNEELEFNLDAIEAITPSFADELFGRLLILLGDENFKKRIHLKTSKDSVKKVVNLILNKRLKDMCERV